MREMLDEIKQLVEKFGNPIRLEVLYDELMKKGYSPRYIRKTLQYWNGLKLKVKDFVSVELVEE